MHNHKCNRVMLGHTSVHESRRDDELLEILSERVIHGWPLTKAEVQKVPQLYWLFRDEITIIDGIVMKGVRIMICVSL